MNFHIMLCVTGRLYLTKKVIEALYYTKNSNNNINIYCYDESLLSVERTEIFDSFIDKEIISEYNYIEKPPTFLKSYANSEFWNKFKYKESEFKDDIFIIMDNDILVKEGWDTFCEKSIDLYNKNKENLKDVRYISPYRSRYSSLADGKVFKNDDNSLKLINCKLQCGSAFWIFNYDMMKKMDYNSRFWPGPDKKNGHDSTIWKVIKKEEGNILGMCFSWSEERYFLHFGNNVFYKSMCLQKSDENKWEKIIKHISHKNLFETYKNNKKFYDF